MTLEERVLRVPEAAALLGVSTSTYYSAAARGEVPVIRIGRRLVVPGAALARLLGGEELVANDAGNGDRPPTDVSSRA
jgi:excisionase family DNA binding protein